RRSLARRKGSEPLTPRFEVWCSIQLSYRRARGRDTSPSTAHKRRGFQHGVAQRSAAENGAPRRIMAPPRLPRFAPFATIACRFKGVVLRPPQRNTFGMMTHFAAQAGTPRLTRAPGQGGPCGTV